MKLWLPLLALFALFPTVSLAEERAAFWIDLLIAEPLESEEELWKDLATVDLIYIGETHRLKRHHDLQQQVVKKMLATGRPLVLGLEQIEARNQPELNLLQNGTIDFDTFAERIEWKKQWRNYEDYRGSILTAIEGGARVVGLNGPREVIRHVSQVGLDALPREQRLLLPETIHTDDPTYERLMNMLLSVHSAFDPDFLRHVFEAQVSRDDSMAAHMVAALSRQQPAKGKKPLGILIAGSGHLQFGLGTPDRVRWRKPGWQARILLLSESGDLVLTPMEKAMRRAVEIHHRDLKFIRRPVGDYLHVKEWNPNADRD